MRISDWSSDVCSSDLPAQPFEPVRRPCEFAAQHAGNPANVGQMVRPIPVAVSRILPFPLVLHHQQNPVLLGHHSSPFLRSSTLGLPAILSSLHGLVFPVSIF